MDVRRAGKTKLTTASKLHKSDTNSLKKAAINAGWNPKLVSEIVNLEWDRAGVKRIASQKGVTKRQAAILIDLYDSVKLEFAGMFALSQL